ncbi:hypothetical protein C5167_022229 [Papaver somniferum]|uniref:Uncharacterized protein n=1 Tax=Papaver somniferum TaxID=3469 RepID=A0A4Y7JL23_PAPSO|nr:hypothetical protein C5167_022229 [Papaver somniferum]
MKGEKWIEGPLVNNHPVQVPPVGICMLFCCKRLRGNSTGLILEQKHFKAYGNIRRFCTSTATRTHDSSKIDELPLQVVLECSFVVSLSKSPKPQSADDFRRFSTYYIGQAIRF